MKRLFASLSVALALMVGAGARPPETMPKDCLILAMEAQARLEKVSRWTAIALVHASGSQTSHAIVVYTMLDGSLWIYDRTGSQRLDTREREPEPLLGAISKAWGMECDGIVLYAVQDRRGAE